MKHAMWIVLLLLPGCIFGCDLSLVSENPAVVADVVAAIQTLIGG